MNVEMGRKIQGQMTIEFFFVNKTDTTVGYKINNVNQIISIKTMFREKIGT